MCEVKAGIELAALSHHELAALEEARVCKAACGLNDGVAGLDAWSELGQEGREKGECNWLDWVAITFTVVALNAPDEMLDEWRFNCCKGEVGVDVEGANCRQICLDGFGLNSATKARNPQQDSRLGCR